MEGLKDYSSETTVEGEPTPQGTPQPPFQQTIVATPEVEDTMQPNIAPEDMEGLMFLQNAPSPQPTPFQPSIEIEGTPGPMPNDSVETWLSNTTLMSAEDLALLQQSVQDSRDTPEPEPDDEADTILPVELTPLPPTLPRPPRNRILDSVRTGRGRPGSNTRKRKRGASVASRRTRARSEPQEQEVTRPFPMELPRRDEFEAHRTQRLSHENFKWGEPPVRPPVDPDLKNHGVRVVDPQDDDEDGGPMKYRGTMGVVTIISNRLHDLNPDPPQQRPQPRRAAVQQPPPRRRARPAPPPRPLTPEDEVEPEIEPEPVVQGKYRTPPLTMNDMPREILQKLCRELLTGDDDVQIYVYDSWSKVYPASRNRERVNFDPVILRVSKSFYYEGIRVLYGENTFVYSLRDSRGPIAKPPVDVEQIAQDDTSTQVPEDDSSEYQDDDASLFQDPEEFFQTRKKRGAKDWEGDIRVAKYFSLFRKIIIEAEHNRYGRETKQSMADAINFWNVAPKESEKVCKPLVPIDPSAAMEKSKPVAKTKGRTRAKNKKKAKHQDPEPVPAPAKSNIHTLALRIFPSSQFNEQGEKFFTFVPFFNPTSPVIEALSTIMPQFLRLEINWKCIHTSPIPRPTSLKVDMRHLYIRHRVAGGDHDGWRGDGLMLAAREEGARRAVGALGRLGERLQVHCERHDGADGDQFEEDGLFVPEEPEDDEWWPEGADGEFVE